jgi:hypothetical protein
MFKLFLRRLLICFRIDHYLDLGRRIKLFKHSERWMTSEIGGSNCDEFERESTHVVRLFSLCGIFT